MNGVIASLIRMPAALLGLFIYITCGFSSFSSRLVLSPASAHLFFIFSFTVCFSFFFFFRHEHSLSAACRLALPAAEAPDRVFLKGSFVVFLFFLCTTHARTFAVYC